MNSHPMTNSYQSPSQPWTWDIALRQAATLHASDSTRWLQVHAGCVWLTQVDAVPQAEDIWLRSGESLALPAGSTWVLEAWPQARLSLQLQPSEVSAPRRESRPAWMRLEAWTRRASRVLAAA